MKKALLIVLMIFALTLIGCGTKTITKTEYICPKIQVPEEPSYEPVKWQKIDSFYCLEPTEAKKLLKNYLILQAYKEELKTLLKTTCEGR